METGATQSARLMVVEDEILVAEDIRDVLEGFGYEVSAVVSSGEEAIERAEIDPPDLVLMDIMLAGEMDGIAAATVVRKRFNIPVIFLTSHSEDKTVARAKVSDPYGYVTKPYDENDLRNAIVLGLYRRTMDQKLSAYRAELEKKVAQQTRTLKIVNAQLLKKIAKLEETGQRLEEKSAQLEDANQALNYLLKQRENDKQDLADRISGNVTDLVLPYVAALGKTRLTPAQQEYIRLIDSNVARIMEPFSHYLSSRHIALTHMELKVADLVRNGKRNKEIAEMLHIADKTVESHRENIRRKLGIKNRKINLRRYLKSMEQH